MQMPRTGGKHPEGRKNRAEISTAAYNSERELGKHLRLSTETSEGPHLNGELTLRAKTEIDLPQQSVKPTLHRFKVIN